MSQVDLMSTDIGDIHVPGWDALLAQHRTRALTLQALANLELRQALEGGEPPIQVTILAEVNRLGGTLSPTSVKVINENIHKLMADGYVVYKQGIQSRKKRQGRGGPASPWRTKFVSAFLRQRLGLNRQDEDKP